METLSKACHSERSEESASARLRPELRILLAVYPERSERAQDDSDFHLHTQGHAGWRLTRWELIGCLFDGFSVIVGAHFNQLAHFVKP